MIGDAAPGLGPNLKVSNSAKTTAHDFQRFLEISACMRQAEKTSFKLRRGEVYAFAQAAMKIISKRGKIRFQSIRQTPDRRFCEKEAEH
jgi:hypothetical protein